VRTVYFNKDSLSNFNHYFQKNKDRWSAVFILVDTNTHQYCLSEFLQQVEIDVTIEILEVDAGEASKDIEIAVGLWQSLIELNADRKALFINLGGGVVCDLGGWVAANYKRGIDFIHVPTSLLAMVDASIGGKTGIDLDGIKNVVGSFSPAEAVLIHPPFLESLAQEEWDSGFAEMLKHALIADHDLWKNLSQLRTTDHEAIQEYIEASGKIKQELVAQDFDEKGLRKILNYGHTLGHAIEALSMENGNSLSHGHAIAIGMVVANLIAMQKGLLDPDLTSEINGYLLTIYTLPSWIKDVKKDIVLKMQKDKKNDGASIKMILLNAIASPLIDIEVKEPEIEKAIDQLFKVS
jgi:3-dehydroquinate synthase